MLLILVNTLVLSLDRHPMSAKEFEILESINNYFSYAFLIEMIIKLIGLGPKAYLSDKFNIFDGTVVLITMVELVLEASNVSGLSTGGAFSAFRAMRLLRVFKLTRKWMSF